MRHRSSVRRLLLSVGVIVLLLGATGAPAAAQTTTASEPVGVVNQLVGAVNRHDWAAVEALFTPGAIVTGGPCAEICIGPAVIVREGIMVPPGEILRVQLVGAPAVSGNTVTVRTEVFFSLPPELAVPGFQRLVQLNSFLIEGNRIAAWSAVDDLADPQTQAFTRMIASFGPDPSHLPEEWIAKDGQTLLMQSVATQIAFLSFYGDQAHVRWVQEHNAALAR